MLKTKRKKANIMLVTRPISPPWDEASKNFAWQLANRINEFNFHLLTYKRFNPEKENLVGHSIYSSSNLNLGLAQKMRLFKFLLKLPREVDLLHFLFTPSKLTSVLVKNIILSRINRSHTHPLKTIQTLATLDFKKINKENVASYLFADKIITYSDYSRKFLEKLGSKNVERIYPGVDLEKFKFRKKSKKILGRFKIKSKEKIILYTGEYVRLKAIDTIIEAFPLVTQRYPKVKLILACRIKSADDAEKKEEIKRRAKESGIAHKLIFIETFSKMEKLYNLADVFIFPVKETAGKFDIPLSVIEAMASQVPSIITDMKPLNEVIKEPGAALKLKEVTAERLAKNILEVLQNQELAAKLKFRGRKNAEDFFDIKKSVKKYQKVYGETLNIS